MKKKLLVILSLLLLTVGVTGCGSQSNDTKIRIGSKNFTENLILAEIYSLALEDNGYDVERNFNISSSVIHTSIVNDEIDLYP